MDRAQSLSVLNMSPAGRHKTILSSVTQFPHLNFRALQRSGFFHFVESSLLILFAGSSSSLCFHAGLPKESVFSFLHIVVFVQSLSPVFRLRWVFIAARGLSLVAGTGFSLWWRLLFWKRKCGTWASGVVARGLSGCSAWAYLPHSLWDLPGPGIKPTSPALTGGLFTRPPGKSRITL